MRAPPSTTHQDSSGNHVAVWQCGDYKIQVMANFSQGGEPPIRGTACEVPTVLAPEPVRHRAHPLEVGLKERTAHSPHVIPLSHSLLLWHVLVMKAHVCQIKARRIDMC